MERTITIEEEGLYREDYQIRMIQDNEVKGFLNIKGRGADEKSYFDDEAMHQDTRIISYV